MPTCPCSKWEFSTGEEQSQGEMKFIDLFQISGPSQAIEQWTQTSRSTKVIECPTKCQWPWNPTVNINLLILVTMVTGINFLGLFLEVYAEYSGFEEKICRPLHRHMMKICVSTNCGFVCKNNFLVWIITCFSKKGS